MTRIIILAAGQGTRMNSELPKVLVSLKNRPMIKYLMDSVAAAGVDVKPLVVVSPDNKEIISRELKKYNVEYVVQTEQLGTGHAVACAREFIEREGQAAKNVVVLYGDHPFLTSESIKKISTINPKALTMMVTTLPDFSGWYQNFYHWGRIIRSAKGEVEKIVEFKDASEAEKAVTEVNPAFMCFNKDWLFKNISNLRDNNKQKEYYLTDLVKIAFDEGHPVSTVKVGPPEAMGINSLEELKIAESLLA
jgi:bifunctional UDP-N-acetylglucosamine pyrophosphorylase/glucosamine-1-phosphate N-acetyltransferase